MEIPQKYSVQGVESSASEGRSHGEVSAMANAPERRPGTETGCGRSKFSQKEGIRELSGGTGESVQIGNSVLDK